MSQSETCTRCHQEVRWGWRHGREGYWHREDVDHVAIFGQQVTPEMFAEVEHQLDLPRERVVKVDPEGFPLLFEIETYTAREVDEERYRKSEKWQEAQAAEAALHPEVEEEEGHEVEPIEVYSTPMPHKGHLLVPTSSGERQVPVPGGVRTVLNRAAAEGWEVLKLTYARGPYLGVSGKSLGVSDTVRLLVRGPLVDGHPLWGVASWRDGKSDWAWIVQQRQITHVGVKSLINLMKENPHHGPDA